jgi:hypothetical protein
MKEGAKLRNVLMGDYRRKQRKREKELRELKELEIESQIRKKLTIWWDWKRRKYFCVLFLATK